MGTANESNKHPIIIIGTGSAGVRLVHQLLYQDPNIPIKIFGGEDQQPYSRDNLLQMLNGKFTEDQLHAATELPDVKNVEILLNNPIKCIDSKRAKVTDSLGEIHSYNKLVLAIGAQANMLEVEGVELDNVLTFRNIHDAELLKSRQVGSRRTVVIGGGQVGLDVAYAMKRHNTEVTVIESSSRLMYHQLDDHASVYLRLYLADLGIDVRTERHVVKIEGDHKVKKVILNTGESILCDTVIISIGIKPNTSLAIDAGLKINKGIVINEHLQTSKESIYAIGECTEFQNRVFGSAKPGYEQAEVLANILINHKGKYNGSISMSRLSVVDYPILSIGDNGDDYISNKEIKYRDIKKMVYRKLVLNNGKLRGVVAAGKWKDSESLYDLVIKNKHIWPWQRKHFEKTGDL